MKRVIIDSKYVVDIDDYNHTLIARGEKKNVKTGAMEYKETAYGYFGSMESVLNKIIKMKITEKIDGEISLPELRNIIIEVKNEIHDVCAGLGI